MSASRIMFEEMLEVLMQGNHKTYGRVRCIRCSARGVKPG